MRTERFWKLTRWTATFLVSAATFLLAVPGLYYTYLSGHYTYKGYQDNSRKAESPKADRPQQSVIVVINGSVNNGAVERPAPDLSPPKIQPGASPTSMPSPANPISGHRSLVQSKDSDNFSDTPSRSEPKGTVTDAPTPVREFTAVEGEVFPLCGEPNVELTFAPAAISGGKSQISIRGRSGLTTLGASTSLPLGQPKLVSANCEVTFIGVQSGFKPIAKLKERLHAHLNE